MQNAVPADKPEIVITRVFAAPCELVYELWTHAEYVRQWWGAENCTIGICELDVREGGAFRIDMKSADGTVYVNRGTYTEVVENERLVYRDVREGAPNTERIPVGTHTILFEDHDRGTLVTLISRFESIEVRDALVGYGVAKGIGASLDRLARLITNRQSESR